MFGFIKLLNKSYGPTNEVDPVDAFTGKVSPYAGGRTSSCVTEQALTRKEEYDVAHLLLDAFRVRPGDWEFNQHYLTDKRTKMQLWIANDADHLRMTDPFSCMFRVGTQAKLWAEIHKLRHETELPMVTELKKQLTEANAEEQGKDQVEKLKKLVRDPAHQKALTALEASARQFVPNPGAIQQLSAAGFNQEQHDALRRAVSSVSGLGIGMFDEREHPNVLSNLNAVS